MRLFLLTMTQERVKDIGEMISNIYPVFDGIIGLVNQPSKDGTFELLEANKGHGKILKAEWTNHHGFLMNHLFFYGGLKDGDWCVYLDSPEAMTDYFVYNIKNFIVDLECRGSDALFCSGRPYLFKYNEYMQFHNAVHWGISGFVGNPVFIPQEKKSEFFLNKRDLTPEISFCLNPIKYWVCYALSNEVQAMYGKYGQDIVNKHEEIRKRFRSYCKNVLNIDLRNLEGLIDYMKKIDRSQAAPDSEFVDFVELEFRLSELYQLKVLGFYFMTKMHPRYKWSFKNHLAYGDGWHDKNYEGTILKYDKGIF